MSHSCFIHSSVDGRLGCFRILEIVNNAAMNIGVLMFFWINVWVPSDTFPEVGLLGQKADPFYTFWGAAILFSTAAAPACIPTHSAEGFPFLRILASTCFLIYWWWPLWQVWGDISLWFLFASLWCLVTLNIFSHVYWPCVCPLWRSVYSGPLPIF